MPVATVATSVTMEVHKVLLKINIASRRKRKEIQDQPPPILGINRVLPPKVRKVRRPRHPHPAVARATTNTVPLKVPTANKV